MSEIAKIFESNTKSFDDTLKPNASESDETKPSNGNDATPKAEGTYTLATIPKLDGRSGAWIPATSVKMSVEFKWARTTLVDHRNKSTVKAVDGNSGITNNGFVWRRDPDDFNKIWYLVESLRVNLLSRIRKNKTKD